MAPECMDPAHFTGISQLVAAELLLKPRKQHRICRKDLFAAEKVALLREKRTCFFLFFHVANFRSSRYLPIPCDESPTHSFKRLAELWWKRAGGGKTTYFGNQWLVSSSSPLVLLWFFHLYHMPSIYDNMWCWSLFPLLWWMSVAECHSFWGFTNFPGLGQDPAHPQGHLDPRPRLL